MRLINISTGVLEDFSARSKPRYAVLSHRWGADEILFSAISSDDMVKDKLLAHTKIGGLIRQVLRDRLEYVWVDTCCIDKSSSAELSEAINSMYSWYQGAVCCYVYLHDVEKAGESGALRDSEWFSRGWTLQELLAPSVARFYDRDWKFLGDKTDLCEEISVITGIDLQALKT